MKEENIQVTPDIAKQWLERNANCRRMSKSNAAYFAKLMLQGLWVENHPDPIMFDKDGRLRNGQHRLRGVIDSGAVINMRVQWDCSEDVLLNIDNGRTRALYEIIPLHQNATFSRLISSTATAFVQLNDGKFNRKIKPTASEAKQFLMDWGEELDFVIPRAAATTQLRRSHVALAVMQYMRRSSKKGRAFAQSLYTVDGEVQQARVLRDYLLCHPVRGNVEVLKQYHYTVMACGYFEIDKPVIALNHRFTWAALPKEQE